MVRSITRWWLFSLLTLSLIAMCALTACAKTPPNTTQTTAPTLTWKVLNRDDNSIQTYTGNANVSVKKGTAYTVTLIADDAGGVKQITLGSSSQWLCQNGNVATASGPSLDKTDVQDLKPDKNNQVLTSIFLIRNVTLDFFTCQPGFTLVNGSESLFGSSTNYASQKAQATLILHI